MSEIDKNFESFITRLSYFLLTLFSLLSIPPLVGGPAVVGVVMSLGLLIYIRLRQCERVQY